VKRSSGVSVQSCALFSVLMLAASAVSCLILTWFVATGVGIWALARETAPARPPVSDEEVQTDPGANHSELNFTLLDLDGRQVSLDDFSGRPVVVNFWATWCPPCRAEVPHLIEAYQRESGEVIFIAISVDEPASTVRRFATQNDMPFIILLDDGGKVASRQKVRAIPVTLFINRDGEIVARYAGQMSPARIEQGLSRIR
jgi:thiol-disulfide isomerase/thioredoxin